MKLVVTQLGQVPPAQSEVASGIAAQPGGQAGATVLTARVNVVTVVAPSTAVRVSIVNGRYRQDVSNRSGENLPVFPPVGHGFVGQAVNTAITLADGDDAVFLYRGSETWDAAWTRRLARDLNLADLPDKAAAWANLGGGAVGKLTVGAGLTSSGGALAANVRTVAGRAGDVMLTTSDLSDAGGAATLDVGNAAGTVAAGDDPRIVGAMPVAGGVTMTGLFGLAGDAVSPMQPVTKGYADGIKATAETALAAATGGPIVSVGNWNATTNSPTITSSNGSAVGGVAGRALTVAVAGTTNINGEAVWSVGDAIVWGGSVWYRIAYGGVYATVDGATMTDLTASGPSGDFLSLAVAAGGGVWEAADPRIGLLGQYLLLDDSGAVIHFTDAEGLALGPVRMDEIKSSSGDSVSVRSPLVIQTGAAIDFGSADLSHCDPRLALLGVDIVQDATGAVLEYRPLEGARELGDIAVTAIYPSSGAADYHGLLAFQGAGSGYSVGDDFVGLPDVRYALLGSDLVFDGDGAVIQYVGEDGVGQGADWALRSATVEDVSSDPGAVPNRAFVEALSSNPYLEPKRDFSAVGDGVTDDSAAVNACLAASLSRGRMAVDHSYNVPTLSKASGGVICVGRGEFLNSPSPRLVVPATAPATYPTLPATARLRNACPNAALAARTTGRVRAAVVGDSVATPGVAVYSYFETFFAQFHAAMLRDNPGIKFDWFARANGGGNLAQINSFPAASLPAWYVDPEQPWLDYLEALDLDILFISCARNGAAAIKWEDIREIRAKMALWTKPCDLVMCNSVGETLEAIEGVQTGLQVTENYEYAAGVIGSYCRSHNIPLIDSESVQSAARWGFAQEYLPMLRDLEAFALEGLTGLQPIAMPFQFATPVYGYGATMRVRAGGWATMGNELVFEIGQAKTNQMKGCKFFLRRNAGTNEISYEVTTTRIADGATNDWVFVPSTNTGVIVSDAQLLSFVFQLQGSRLYFEFIGQSGDVPSVLLHVPKAGGPWRPQITCAAGTVANAVDFLVDSQNVPRVATSRPKPETLTMPSVTDTEFASPADAPLLAWGGGGPHPGSLAAQRIILPAIAVNDFSLAP